MKEKEEKLQSLYMEFQVLGQNIKQLEEKTHALNNQLMELTFTNQSLEDMKKIKPDTEILVPLSGGIYAKAKLKDSKNVIVNVGANTTIVKDVQSTKTLIETQIEEVKKLQANLVNQMQVQTTKAALIEQQINEMASTLKK